MQMIFSIAKKASPRQLSMTILPTFALKTYYDLLVDTTFFFFCNSFANTCWNFSIYGTREVTSCFFLECFCELHQRCDEDRKRREASSQLQCTRQVSIPAMFSGSSNSFLLSSLFRSKRAESRLWQRGWSSLGGFRASCFSRSAALGRWLGFLSKAASITSLMPGLQSSAISSNGGACLWI